MKTRLLVVGILSALFASLVPSPALASGRAADYQGSAPVSLRPIIPPTGVTPMDNGSTYYLCKIYGPFATNSWPMRAGEPWRDCTGGTTSGVIGQWYQGHYVAKYTLNAYDGSLTPIKAADIPKMVDCVVAIYGGYGLVKLVGKSRLSWVGVLAVLWSLRSCVA